MCHNHRTRKREKAEKKEELSVWLQKSLRVWKLKIHIARSQKCFLHKRKSPEKFGGFRTQQINIFASHSASMHGECPMTETTGGKCLSQNKTIQHHVVAVPFPLAIKWISLKHSPLWFISVKFATPSRARWARCCLVHQFAFKHANHIRCTIKRCTQKKVMMHKKLSAAVYDFQRCSYASH